MALSRGILVMAIVAAVTTGCGGGQAGTPASQPTPQPSAATPASVPSTTAAGRPSGTGQPAASSSSSSSSSWSSEPVTVEHHPAVPPVPVVLRVRSAAHPAEGFDRLVIDIDGPLPGYSVRYVSQVLADPSDQVVAVPGRHHLLVVLDPAQAHRDDGTATVSGVHRLDLPVLRAYAIVGDFEGHVSIAVGLDDVIGYRVGELPGRIYLDVAA